MKNVLVLGSTGSIGRQTISVLENLGYCVAGLSAHSDIDRLGQQIRQFHPPFAAVADHDAAQTLSARVSDTKTKIFSGERPAVEAANAAPDHA